MAQLKITNEGNFITINMMLKQGPTSTINANAEDFPDQQHEDVDLQPKINYCE